jgi:osmotically-inducible protein OsmY
VTGRANEIHHAHGSVAHTGYSRAVLNAQGKITTKVEAVFSQHPEVGTRVGVQTISHVVYLSGIVSDPSVIITAANLVGQVKGVSRVENTIVVSQ